MWCLVDLIDMSKTKAEFMGWQFKFLKNKKINTNFIEDLSIFYKYSIVYGKPIVSAANILEMVFMPWNKNYRSNIKILRLFDDLIPSLGTLSFPFQHYYNFYAIKYKGVTRRKILILEVFERQ